jgi:hypothetical protein
VQSDDLHIGLVSWFLSILSLRGRLNLGNKILSHIYLNLFSPLSRLLEDFRNAYEGAELVLVGHSKPNFVKGGKPQLASANEMNALLVAAVELWRASGLEPKECLAKVSKDAGISEKQLRNIRTRFGRGDGVAKKYKELAFRLARPATHEEIYRYYLSLLDRYQSLK